MALTRPRARPKLIISVQCSHLTGRRPAVALETGMRHKILGISSSLGGLAYLAKWFFSKSPAAEPMPEAVLHMAGIGVALGLLVVGGYYLLNKH